MKGPRFEALRFFKVKADAERVNPGRCLCWVAVSGVPSPKPFGGCYRKGVKYSCVEYGARTRREFRQYATWAAW